ncbi:hypothetical protein BSKO_00392 [Bryopsis sp. KO-2023]|nr:hypothetical protein BSKO_00392 [Bryopsis sp. KO-2023]
MGRELWDLVTSANARGGGTKICVASLGEGGSVTFREYAFETLVHKVSALSSAIDAVKPVASDETPRVAVLIERSFEYVVAVLAAVKSGCAFVPVDCSWPSSRLSHVCAAVEACAAIVTSRTNSAGIDSFRHISTILDADALEQGLRGRKHVRRRKRRNRNAPPHCYVMYTSGSSGVSKGVLGTADGLINRYRWMQSIHPFREDDFVAFTTSTCFVDSLWQMFAPLFSGTNMLIVPDQILHQPETFAQLVQDVAVTHLVGVPSLLRYWKDSLSQRQQSLKLRLIVSSGDFLPQALSDGLLACLPADGELLNLYGCTEVSADCTFHSVKPPLDGEHRALSTVAAGIPISNTIVAVVRHHSQSALSGDQNVALFQPVERDCEGEIWVGGRGLATGYLGRCTSLSTSAFVTISKSEVIGALDQEFSVVFSDGYDLESEVRFFRTKDRGKISKLGVLWVLGRLDFRCKRNGMWIDLHEIEMAAAEHPHVLEAAAQLLPADGVGQELHIYVIPATQSDKASRIFENEADSVEACFSHALFLWLGERLPQHALPSKVYVVQDFPRTSTGKVQRAALQPPSSSSSAHRMNKSNEMRQRVAEREGPEARVLTIFREALQHVKVEPSSNFFLLGGTSVAAVEVAHKLSLDPAMIPAFPTPRSLARAMADGEGLPTPPLGQLGRSSASRMHELEIHCKASEREQTCWSIIRRVCSMETQSTKDGVNEPSEKRPRIGVQGNSTLILETVLARKPAGRPDNTRAKVPSVTGYLANWKEGKYVECHAACSSNRILIMKKDGQTRWERVDQLPSAADPRPAQRESSKNFVELWSSKLSQCVDASPALVLFLETRTAYSREGLAIGCCHGGAVGCFDLFDGSDVWSTQLDGRADAGLAVTGDLLFVVVASVDRVLFLRLVDGGSIFSVNAGGVVNSAPVVDPWQGLVWCTSHGKQIIAATPENVSVRFTTESPISASVCFDESRKRVYAGCLDGKVIALEVSSARTNTGVTVAWTFDCDGPIFGSADVDPISGLVVVATVKGSVYALSSQGRSVWSLKAEAPVFAPAVLLHDHVFVTSQTGALLLIKLHTGDIVCRIEAHTVPISRPPVFLASKAAGSGIECVILLCSTGGLLTALALGGQDSVSVSILASSRLEYEVFSGLLALRGFAVFGSRGDRLHCIELV